MLRTYALRSGLLSLREFIAPLTTMERPAGTCFTSHPHVVLHSNAHDINANLTAEEALVRGVVLSKGERMLLMYRNTPCVVVGRNQNVFQEAAMRRARADGVRIARRSSGGGAVYQDEGNLCLSFFSHRTDYAPERTIQIVRHGLSHCCGVAPARLTTTHRHDLFLDVQKITGSAMRVQRDIAYHHCTLLVDTPLAGIGSYLHGEGSYTAFTTTSVGSVRSPVTSLSAKGLLPPSAMASREVGPPPTGEAVALVAADLASFFLRYGPFIASHEAPWELTMEEILAHPRPGCTSPLTLDVRRSLIADDVEHTAPFLAGVRRPRSSVDCATFAEELARVSAVDWLFAMPPFTTTIAITRDELHAHALTAPMVGLLGLVPGEEKRLSVKVTVDHRRVSDVAVTAGAPDCAHEEVAWLQEFLRALLCGRYCDASLDELLPLSGGDRDVLLRGLWMELGKSEEALALAEKLPAARRDEDLLHAVRALLIEWRRKNVFDYAEV